MPVDFDRVSMMSELRFAGRLRQGETAQLIDVIIDTGAGFGYFLLPKNHLHSNTWTFQQCAHTVKLANGSVCPIEHQLSGSLSVGGVDHSVCLRVLPTSDSTPSILAGRELIEQFRLSLRGSSEVWSKEGVLLFPGPSATSPIREVPDIEQGPTELPLPQGDLNQTNNAMESSIARTAHAFAVSEDRQPEMPGLIPCSLPLRDSDVVSMPRMPAQESIATAPSHKPVQSMPVNKQWTTIAVDDSVFVLMESVEGPSVSLLTRSEAHATEESLPSNCSSIVHPHDSVMEGDAVEAPVTQEEDIQMVHSILSSIVEQKERDLLYCSDAKLELIELPPNAPRDLWDQTHMFRLRLPATLRKPSSGSYSHVLYKKLKEEHQKQFDQLTQQYIDAGWWEEVDPNDPRASHPTDVFLHKPGTEGGRLVCDYRAFNKLFKDVSSSAPLIEHILFMLRTETFPHVFIGDCSKAFYRIAIEPALPLRAGPKVYICSRVSFGLTMGPESLRCSLGLLMDSWRQAMRRRNEKGILSLFVDDFQLLAENNLLPSLILLLRKCGFSVSKRKAQFSYPLKVFGSIIDREKKDGDWEISATAAPLEGVSELLVDLRRKPTKRIAFALGGKISYDPMRVRPKLKVLGDMLRSIFGSLKFSWDTPVSFDRSDDKLVASILDAIEELVGLYSSTSVDPDRSSIRTSATVNRFRISCDASIYGYGFAIKINETVATQTASLWKRHQQSYHSNRLEGLALLRALRTICGYLEFKSSISFQTQDSSKLEIDVFTDSKSALSWANGRPPTNFKDSVEYRMLVRLQSGLTAELAALKGLAKASIAHIAGESNTEADDLSRLSALFPSFRKRFFRNETDPINMLDDAKLNPVLKLSDITDFDPVLKLSDTTDFYSTASNWIERIASECFDFDQFLVRFSTICKSFDALRKQPVVSDSDIIKRLAQSVQVSTLDSKQRSIYVLREDGLYYHEYTDYNGALISRPVLPRAYPLVARLLARTFHRRGHRGVNFDVTALLTRCPMFVEGSLRVCKAIHRQCLICAMMRTPKVLSVPASTFPRRFDLPPFSRSAMDILHITKRDIILSAMCVDTGVIALIKTVDLSMDSIVGSIQVLAARYCVSFKRILWDNFPTFASSKVISRLRLAGHPDLEIVHTPVAGSQQNPVERAHRECWQIIRARGFVKILKKNPESQNCLDLISSVINQRPLVRSSEETVLTPAILAFGSCHGVDGSIIQSIRSYFYRECFLLRRRRHNPHQRREMLSVGCFVLIHKSNPLKEELPYKVGRLIEYYAGTAIVRSAGKNLRVPVTSLCPLDEFFNADASGDSSGGRVVNNSSRDVIRSTSHEESMNEEGVSVEDQSPQVTSGHM